MFLYKFHAKGFARERGVTRSHILGVGQSIERIISVAITSGQVVKIRSPSGFCNITIIQFYYVRLFVVEHVVIDFKSE